MGAGAQQLHERAAETWAGCPLASALNTTIYLMKPSHFPPFSKSAFTLLALAAAAVVLNSCRTTEGFGRDLQKVGNKIENEASRRG